MNFDIKKTIDYWVSGAEYDIATAGELLKNKRFPYVLFFGHLALEKLLKAMVIRDTSQHAPYTHSLPALAGKLKMEIPEDIKEKLMLFMEFHFEARYPDEKTKFYKKCTKNYAEHNLIEIRKVYVWLKKQL